LDSKTIIKLESLSQKLGERHFLLSIELCAALEFSGCEDEEAHEFAFVD
jgi:hypothetical protein